MKKLDMSATLLLVVASALHAVSAQAAEPLTVKPHDPAAVVTQPTVDTEWEALFTRQEGWNGGDVAGTVDLEDGRMLWLFGDTIFGKVADGKRLPGSVMVNNSAAVHPWDAGKSTAPPRPEQIQFFAGPRDAQGKITALFPPTRAADAATNAELAELEEYWPTGGGAVHRAGDGKRRLYVGLFRIRKTKKEQGTWGFRRVGSSLGIVDDIDQPVEKWQTRVVSIPHAVGDHEATKERPSVSWGEVFLKAGSRKNRSFMIYGVRTSKTGKRQLILANPGKDLEDFDAWRFFYGGASGPDFTKAAAICDDVAPEFTIEPVMGNDAWLLMVQNEPLLGPSITVRTANLPIGPWSKPQEIYRPTLAPGDKDLFSYAAKGHILVSRPDELLVTYIVSAHDFWRLFKEADLYRPRFVRIPLSSIIPEK